MAQKPEVVFDFIKNISDKALVKSKEEIENLKLFFGLEVLNASDIPYYVRKYKREKFDLREDEIKQYFEYENTLTWLHSFVKDFF
jgi:Zn-dependent oligopeptidase